MTGMELNNSRPESPFDPVAEAAVEDAAAEQAAAAPAKILGPIAVEVVAADDMVSEGGPVFPEA